MAPQSTAGRRGPPGFTLVELLVSLTILAILAALSAAGLEPLVMRVRTQQAAAELYEAVGQAQALARASGRCVRLEVLLDETRIAFGTAPALPVGQAGNGLRLMRWNSADCESTSDASLVEVLPLPSNALARVAVGSPPLIFRPGGRPREGATLLEVVRDPSPLSEALAQVVVTANGPACLFTGSTSGACP